MALVKMKDLLLRAQKENKGCGAFSVGNMEMRDGYVAFHIRDYGKGIDPERLKTIFDGAGIEPNASGDSHKGMGIGLTICKTIINAHNGNIEAANRLKGAEFIFTLPLEEEEEHDK